MPVLIVLALGLVVAQPLGRRGWAARRRETRARPAAARRCLVPVLLTGVYGGYFGAAHGVLLIAILGILVETDLQRMNALKNVLIGLVNGVAGVVFILLAHPDWTYVAIIAVGATLGGQIGGLRRPPPVPATVACVHRHRQAPRR